MTQTNEALSRLSVGDVVETYRVYRVTNVTKNGARLRDVVNGCEFWLEKEGNHGSLSVGVLMKAAKPKPKVGDVLTAQEVRAIQWKRGSVLTATDAQDDAFTYMLDAEGVWQSPSPNSDDLFGIAFGELEDDSDGNPFTVVHVA